ncbi:MAG: hypothetical protein ACI4U5_00955 [Bacilli bacterium]
MKKTLTLLLASLVATTGILASCGKKKTETSSSDPSTSETTTSINSQTPATSSSSSTIPPESFVEVGEFSITWINGIGSSYQLLDSGVLPGKANTNETISFTLALAYGVEVAPTVKANDDVLTPVDGVYSFKVTADTVVKTADLDINYKEIVEYSSYYLQLGSQEYENKEENRFIVDKYPVYSNEQYYFENIDLEIGDTFRIYDGETEATLLNYETVDGVLPTGSVAADGTFTCTEKGTYAMYVKVTGDETIVYVECANEREIRITGLESGYTYYVWSWGGDKANTWLDGVLDGTVFTFTLPKRASGFLIAQFNEGLAIEDASWDVKVKQSEDMAPVKGVSSYAVVWKAS